MRERERDIETADSDKKRQTQKETEGETQWTVAKRNIVDTERKTDRRLTEMKSNKLTGLVRWPHAWKFQTIEYNVLPVGGTAGKFDHQCCGTLSKMSPTCHRQDVPGWLWLLCWSYCWTELETRRRDCTLVPRIHWWSDELCVQDSLAGHCWQLRSGPVVQVRSCILQKISNREKCSPTDADYIYFAS